jgi:AraC-like DNA-binding protein
MTSDGGLLALGISRIHRSDSLEALMETFLSVAPTLVEADAFGLYLLDGRLQARAVYALRADRGFLTGYERLRMSDPCFLHLLRHRSFIHTRELLAQREWVRHPLRHFMSRWGLRYSIEAPLMIGRRLAGTLNIARRDRDYFGDASLSHARFLCDETAYAFERLARTSRPERLQARERRRPARAPAARRERDRPAEPAWIGKAEGLIRSDRAEPLTIERLAAASGVSPRTLLDGFRRYRGISPMAMLRDLRFESARSALVLATPGTATVADIATACGFYELGRFSVEYRRRYAEAPSETLRRADATPESRPRNPAIYQLADAALRPGGGFVRAGAHA